MKKQMFTPLILVLMLWGAVTSAQGKKPNILFILADDQSPFDLKVYDPNSSLDTPVLDRLAAEGTVFDGAYHMGAWSGAVCTPSRHMIMSGRTVWHIPGKGNPHTSKPEMVPPDLVNDTMAAVFNRAGYDTMRTCKKGNSYGAANKQFTVVHDSTKRGDTDEKGSAWHAEQVLNYLNEREATKDNDPFLIYYGFSHPHDPRNGKVDLLAKYGAVNHNDKDTPPALHTKQPLLPPNYLPTHPFPHGHPGLRDEVSVQGVWERRDEATIRNELGREFACSENIDIQIGRVLDKLKAMGELDNTIIFYTADHGIAIGRHGLQGKQNLYQHTWRVPYIVKGPGIKAGTRVEGNIYLLDTLRTLCDLVGINTPAVTEGISFKPVLQGKQDKVRDILYGVYCGGTKPGMRSVKKGDWKLIKYDVLDGKVRETQLFNLKENPHELLKEHHEPEVVALTGHKPKPNQVNLADDPRYAAKRKEMEALLLEEQQRHGDPYRLWDQPQVPKQPKGVVLILIDDIGYGDIHALSPSDLKTPHLDTLHANSVRFTDFHVGTTCSPTRGALMTGRCVNAGGVFHTIAGRSILRDGEQTLAEIFKANGWRTGIFGKWHLGDGYPYFPRHRGFDVEVIHGGGASANNPITGTTTIMQTWITLVSLPRPMCTSKTVAPLRRMPFVQTTGLSERNSLSKHLSQTTNPSAVISPPMLRMVPLMLPMVASRVLMV